MLPREPNPYIFISFPFTKYELVFCNAENVGVCFLIPRGPILLGKLFVFAEFALMLSISFGHVLSHSFPNFILQI